MRELDVMPLRSQSDPRWGDVVLANFDDFLLDHAACERKAAALAMSFVVKYPDKIQLIEPMICLAREELAHFHEVYQVIAKRQLILGPDVKDPYLGELLKHVRHGRDEHFMDRLLVSGIVEARGCERFALIAKKLETGEMHEFYEKLARSEAGHYMVFIRTCRHYFTEAQIQSRLSTLLEVEAEVLSKLELRPAVH